MIRQEILRWQDFLDRCRRFFRGRGYLEVQTPKLIAFPALETDIESIQAYPMGLSAAAGFLISSPEYAMKKLLAEGSGPIFQITPVFREKEQGTWHNPEFTMLEWYQTELDHHQLMAETYQLFSALIPSERLLSFQKTSYQQLFQRALGIDPLEPDVVAWQTTLGPLWQTEFFQQFLPDQLDAILDYLLAFHIQPKLGQSAFDFIYDFPIRQAPLAQKNPDGKTGGRFEAFWQGIELVNGYFELTDSKEQQERFESTNRARLARGKQPLPIDHSFLAQVDRIPPSAGAALGLDRLFLLLEQKTSLSELYHLNG